MCKHPVCNRLYYWLTTHFRVFIFFNFLTSVLCGFKKDLILKLWFSFKLLFMFSVFILFAANCDIFYSYNRKINSLWKDKCQILMKAR